jgi:hypothetical protein
MKNRLGLQKLNQRGFDHVIMVICFVLIFGVIGVFFLIKDYADTSGYTFRLDYGAKGSLCLDDLGNSKSAGNEIDVYTCKPNDTAQIWTKVGSGNFALKSSISGSNICIQAGAGIGVSGHRVPVTTATCRTSNSSQLWHWSLSAPSELVSSASGGCMNDAANGGSTSPIIIYKCTPATSNARWYESVAKISSGTTNGGSSSAVASCAKTGNEGQTIANCALYQLDYWNNNPSRHAALIDTYCGGESDCENGEWCAGFVSYVYKESGYSFGSVLKAFNLGYQASLKGFTFKSTPSVGAIAISTGGGNLGHAQIVYSTSGPTFISGNYGNIVIKTTDRSGTIFGYETPN